MQSLCVGIDLGTSNSVITSYDRIVECIPSAQGSHVNPSIISYDQNGRLFVCEEARHNLLNNNCMGIQYAKRVIGYQYDSQRVKENPNMCISSMKKSYNGKVEFYNDNLKKTETPISVYVKLIKYMLNRAKVCRGRPVTHLVLTVPADFKQEQILDTETAIEEAGLPKKNYTLLKEPIAAAIGYEAINNNDEYTVVYDLGGGTFDVTVMHLFGEQLRIVAYGGDEAIGGMRFDNLIMKYVIESIRKRKHMELLPSEKSRSYRRKYHLLLSKCREAKELLATLYNSDIDLLDIADEELLDEMEYFTITREEVKEILSECIQRTIDIVDRTIERAGIHKSRVSNVLMVGGSSRLLAVEEALVNYFGRHDIIKNNANPDEVVAKGAAIFCKFWSKHPRNMFIEINERKVWFVERITLTLGFKDRMGNMVPLVSNGDPIPSRRVRKLMTTDEDNVRFMRLEFYQGENEQADNNMRMRAIEWGGFPALPKGEVKFVLYLYYTNSLWECEVRDFYTKQVYFPRQVI